MSKCLFACLFLFILTQTPVALNAQNPAARSTDKTEFVQKAREVNEQMSALITSGQFAYQPLATPILTLLKEVRALAGRVKKTGAQMTDSQYQSFQRELQNLDMRLDQLQDSDQSTNGQLRHDCFFSCNKAYKGNRGSSGWSRLSCKIGCFQVNFIAGS